MSFNRVLRGRMPGKMRLADRRFSAVLRSRQRLQIEVLHPRPGLAAEKHSMNNQEPEARTTCNRRRAARDFAVRPCFVPPAAVSAASEAYRRRLRPRQPSPCSSRRRMGRQARGENAREAQLETPTWLLSSCASSFILRAACLALGTLDGCQRSVVRNRRASLLPASRSSNL